MTVIVVALVFVDVAALCIGISIRRKVTRIISETAANIEDAVKGGIADAVTRFVTMATELLAANGSQPAANGLVERLTQVTEQLRS